MNYRSAGVEIDKGDRIVASIRKMMGASGAEIGHFGGAVEVPENVKNPLIISSIDGVGTKIKIASDLKRFDAVGKDLLHHCINDIACCGALPLAFLDYIAMSSMDVDAAIKIVNGIIESCREWNVKLAGGENAEMPGVYCSGEFDLVGAIIGIVDKDDYIDGRDIDEDDVMIGFPSNGLHTNGFSLARRIIADEGISYTEISQQLDEAPGDALLKVHTCYLKEIQFLKRHYDIKGLAHITGGGLPGNVSRITPTGLQPVYDWGGWKMPPIFNALKNWGDVNTEDMQTTFNLGIGLVAVLNKNDAAAALNSFDAGLSVPVKIGSFRKN